MAFILYNYSINITELFNQHCSYCICTFVCIYSSGTHDTSRMDVDNTTYECQADVTISLTNATETEPDTKNVTCGASASNFTDNSYSKEN